MYYTDGFTGAVNADGDRFDEENLFNAFQWACQNLSTTNAILDYLFERIEEFTGKSSSNKDDMTLIIMKVSESS